MRKWLVVGCVAPSVAGATIWGALALWFALPGEENVRAASAIGYASLGVVGLAMVLFHRKSLLPLLPVGFAFAAILTWMATLEPSNERAWQPDVARLPGAEIDGDLVSVRNIRSFKYHEDGSFTEHWYDKTVDLRRLDRLDVIAVHWMGDDIAHIMVSFGFGDDQIAVSIEARKERGEDYSTLGGFFRQYELYYVLADESDVIGLRTTYRNPPEDVYVFNVAARKENIKLLFLEYAKKVNQLQIQPEFYNTGTTNCTTNIAMHVHTINRDAKFDWRALISGHFPELIYEAGGMDTSMPYADLRKISLVNEKARAADGTIDFSRRIREGLPQKTSVFK